MIFYTYVDILFNIAKKDNQIDHINEQFAVLMTLIDSNPEWVTTLDTPVFNNEKKFELLKQLKLFDDTFLKFLLVLIRNRHVRLINDIYNEWLVKSRQEQRIAFIQLYSAKKPTKAILEGIREDIQPLMPDLKIEFNVHLDPTLIRGIRLYYQGRSLERSMKRELFDMANSL